MPIKEAGEQEEEEEEKPISDVTFLDMPGLEDKMKGSEIKKLLAKN